MNWYPVVLYSSGDGSQKNASMHTDPNTHTGISITGNGNLHVLVPTCISFDLYELIYIILYILFYTCTNPFLSFCSVITVLTTILIMQTKMKKKMRIIVTKERTTPIMGNQLGLCFVPVLKLMEMCIMCMWS